MTERPRKENDLLSKLRTAYCHQCSEERQNTVCESPCPRQREIVAEHDASLTRKVHEELINAIHLLGTTEDCPYGNCRRARDTVHDPWSCVKCISEFLRSSKYGKPEEGKTGSKIIYCPHCGTNSEVSTIRCQTEYPEFAIFTCYNCGKTHIRDVKESLIVKALASHPLQNPDKFHSRFQEH